MRWNGAVVLVPVFNSDDASFGSEMQKVSCRWRTLQSLIHMSESHGRVRKASRSRRTVVRQTVGALAAELELASGPKDPVRRESNKKSRRPRLNNR